MNKNSWVHIVVEIDGMTMTDSVRADSALQLAEQINKHLQNGAEIIAITSSEEWDALKSDDLTDYELDAWAKELEMEVPE